MHYVSSDGKHPKEVRQTFPNLSNAFHEHCHYTIKSLLLTPLARGFESPPLETSPGEHDGYQFLHVLRENRDR